MSAGAPPVVSAIMAVHDTAPTLRAAIDSILAQSFGEFEFIVVDDGSGDGSADIVRGYRDPRIKFVVNAEREGLARSLNKAISLSTGRYVARMDGDDVSRPIRFERQLREFDADPELGVVGSNVVLVSGTERNLWGLPESSEEIRARFIFENAMSHPSVMARRDILAAQVGPYAERFEFAQDYELWARLATRSVAFKNVQEPLVDYRFVETASRKTLAQRDLARRIRARYLVDLGVDEGSIDGPTHHRLAEGRSPRTMRELVRLVRWCGRLPRLLEESGWDCVGMLRQEIRWRSRDAGRGCESRFLRHAARLARKSARSIERPDP